MDWSNILNSIPDNATEPMVEDLFVKPLLDRSMGFFGAIDFSGERLKARLYELASLQG